MVARAVVRDRGPLLRKQSSLRSTLRHWPRQGWPTIQHRQDRRKWGQEGRSPPLWFWQRRKPYSNQMITPTDLLFSPLRFSDLLTALPTVQIENPIWGQDKSSVILVVAWYTRTSRGRSKPLPAPRPLLLPYGPSSRQPCCPVGCCLRRG